MASVRHKQPAPEEGVWGAKRSIGWLVAAERRSDFAFILSFLPHPSSFRGPKGFDARRAPRRMGYMKSHDQDRISQLNHLLPAGLFALGKDSDPDETAEWIEALEYVIAKGGSRRAAYLLMRLKQHAFFRGVQYAGGRDDALRQYDSRCRGSRPIPGDREIERRIKSIIRWNAMAMVVRANQQSPGIGGHISTFASAATLYEVAFNHFFHGKEGRQPPDQVFFQGHASPGIYARAFLLGRLDGGAPEKFPPRVAPPGRGLSSYPHPWLMPDFWEFPTVSMGLGPIMAIYQARFNHYLVDRGIKPDAEASRVWAFLGDGECDEPETLGAITLAAREQLDNLIFVINCNMQRLDGPVRGNGKIIQELEGAFRGAGWNVIKVIWGSDWDPLLARDTDGAAGPPDGRGGRRPIPEIRGQRGRLHPRALLRRRSAAAGNGRPT